MRHRASFDFILHSSVIISDRAKKSCSFAISQYLHALSFKLQKRSLLCIVVAKFVINEWIKVSLTFCHSKEYLTWNILFKNKMTGGSSLTVELQNGVYIHRLYAQRLWPLAHIIPPPSAAELPLILKIIQIC